MLERLLRLVAEGGVHSYEDLTEHLSISHSLLEAMLEDLARLGYLRPVSSSCGERCAACPIGGCSVRGSGQLWSLTDRGAKAAARLPS